MAINLQNGLFGLGGMGGMSPPMPEQLSSFYDPRAARGSKMKNMMLHAGLSMLGQGPSAMPINFGTSLGQGLQAGVKAADASEKDYRDMAYQTFGIQNQMDERKYGREQDAMERDWRRNVFEYGQKRDGINDQWNQQQRQRQMQEWQASDAKNKQWQDYVAGLPPEQRAIAEMYPDKYAQQQAELMFNTNAAQGKPPTIETLYDEKTGQPYKAQYNNETKSWERIGGNKSPEGGITITNPDGTVTQIGGGNKMTESDHKAQLLAQQIAGQEADVIRGFDSLASPANTIGSKSGMLRGLMSGDAQIAEDAMKNVIANWLYLTSGATATEEEVQRQFSMIRPSYFDKPETIAAKRDRLQSIIRDMKQRGNVKVQPAPSMGGAQPNPQPVPSPQNTGNMNLKQKYGLE